MCNSKFGEAPSAKLHQIVRSLGFGLGVFICPNGMTIFGMQRIEAKIIDGAWDGWSILLLGRQDKTIYLHVLWNKVLILDMVLKSSGKAFSIVCNFHKTQSRLN